MTSIRRILAAAWIAVIAALVLVLLSMSLRHAGGWLTLAILAALALVLALARRWLARHVPRRTMLEVDLSEGVVEVAPDDPLARFAARPALVVRDVVDALRRAAQDGRVVALFARIGPSGMGLAHAQEIRDAVLAFRAVGKKAVAWCQTLGEGHSATVDYYLASAFESIQLQPGSDVGMAGLAVRQPFLRGLLDKVGILPRIDHREEYKSFRNIFTERELTGPHRESLESLLGSQAQQVAEGIAKARGISVEEARRRVEGGPYLAGEALEAKLVDGLAHYDEVFDRLKDEQRARPLYLDRYLARAGRLDSRGPQVALIYGVGGVQRGRSRSRRFPPGLVMGSDDVTAAFRRAIRSKRIRAIVFRVDSPGGSAVASESIWRAVQQARAAGKPVVVSMGNLAGSGGYYIAAGADRIVAQPGTITGSIGVVSGKLVTRDAWGRAGVNWQSVAIGPNAAMWSSTDDFTDPQWSRLQAMLDDIYAHFKARVAEGRKLPTQRVDEVAKGRIWSGAQARELGLVDELGGMEKAVELVKEVAGLPKDKPVQLVAIAKRRRFRLFGRAEDHSEAMAQLASELSDLLQPAGVIAAAAREDGCLRMQGF